MPRSRVDLHRIESKGAISSSDNHRAIGAGEPCSNSKCSTNTYVRELNAIADYKWDEGMAQGIAIGEAKGRAEGKAEAARALVARQLERKFGPLGPEQWALLESATMEQLEHYSDTLLTASSLNEVFVE